ncbi:MAG: uncharacterized protein A8A55_2002 [Amphiamblys sp. WSBS2006]|nr:MAG: uncharacterized protein A8A55_2002 [Amphiamblys sp. WSBS2006]
MVKRSHVSSTKRYEKTVRFSENTVSKKTTDEAAEKETQYLAGKKKKSYRGTGGVSFLEKREKSTQVASKNTKRESDRVSSSVFKKPTSTPAKATAFVKHEVGNIFKKNNSSSENASGKLPGCLQEVASKKVDDTVEASSFIDKENPFYETVLEFTERKEGVKEERATEGAGSVKKHLSGAPALLGINEQSISSESLDIRGSKKQTDIGMTKEDNIEDMTQKTTANYLLKEDEEIVAGAKEDLLEAWYDKTTTDIIAGGSCTHEDIETLSVCFEYEKEIRDLVIKISRLFEERPEWEFEAFRFFEKLVLMEWFRERTIPEITFLLNTAFSVKSKFFFREMIDPGYIKKETKRK